MPTNAYTNTHTPLSHHSPTHTHTLSCLCTQACVYIGVKKNKHTLQPSKFIAAELFTDSKQSGNIVFN